MHTLCRGAAATLKQVPPWADTATSCNATPCTTTRSDLKQSRATSSQRCTWTIKLCQHRKLSWPWRFAQTTALFLFPKLACPSLHHTLLCSHCRNITTSTKICPQTIQVLQSTTEFKHLCSVHPKYLYTQPCRLLPQSFTTFACFTYSGWSHQLHTMHGLKQNKNWRWTCCANWPWHPSYWATSACTLFSPGENLMLGSSLLCLKGPWSEFSKTFNTGLLLKSTPCKYSRSSRAKQELWNFMLNLFWDFPRKYWVIKQKFPLLSVLTLTLSSLSRTDGALEVGRTYIRNNKCWFRGKWVVLNTNCSFPWAPFLSYSVFSLQPLQRCSIKEHNLQSSWLITPSQWRIQVKSKPAAVERGRQLKEVKQNNNKKCHLEPT